MEINELTYATNRIIEYIQSLIDRVSENLITIDMIPINEIENLIVTSYESEIEHKDLTLLYRNTIHETMRVLSNSVLEHDNLQVISLLKLLIRQIAFASNIEISWRELYDNHITILSEKYYCAMRFAESICSVDSKLEGKGVVYTCVTGQYDVLNDPEYVDPNLDYICFTDNNNIKSNVWKIELIKKEDLDNTRIARRYKILPHKYLGQKYNYSIWIDGNIIISADIMELIKKYIGNRKMVCFPHHVRKCLYEEAEICTLLGKDDEDIIQEQISRYKKEGYPIENGLIESGIIFRYHNEESIIRVMEDWWNEVLHYSKRDQLSFNYVCWKHDFKYSLVPYYVANNPYIKYKKHGD